MNRCLAVVLLLLCAGLSSAASAQVIYEPVRYQYNVAGATVYYGGHDHRVLDMIERDVIRTSYSSVATSEHVVKRARVYSDAVPMVNLADKSYTGYSSMTAADARNEANANAPRYFRKRDLLRTGYVMRDGSLVVPAQLSARPNERSNDGNMDAGQPKGMILIIPKKLLQPPAKQESKQVATIGQ
jgi:hypothetical protein